ncbi:MAG: hypothetical protein NTY19_03555, partial [Planctomycetota bacterium]|nr:hypothetical protein [Planctomycetota bacterium]
MRSLPILIAAGLLLPTVAQAQLTVDFGPRGEITKLRVGNVIYFKDIAVSLVKPGWAGHIVDQRAADPSAVKIEKSSDVTTYTTTLSGDGCRVRLRETARVAPDSVALEYEIIPEQEIDTEVVLLQGTMPTELHAGQTDYLVLDGDVSRGRCSAELNRDSYVLFGGCAADWVGFTRAQGPALRVIPNDVLLQFQDNRKWNIPGFALLATTGGGRLAVGKTLRFGITYAADTTEQLETDAKRSHQGVLAGQQLADNRPLAIRSASLDHQTVET